MNNSVKNNQIPIFFATDDNYAPFCGVAIKSLLDNANKDYSYMIYILAAELSDINTTRLLNLQTANCKIEFVDVSRKIDAIGEKIHLRDYYTKASYFRLFIAELFPQYDKALYLDCDIIVVGDIAELYNSDIGDNYVGAIQEEVMDEVEVFGNYVETFLGIKCKNYFSSGILSMNLKQFREQNIESKFVSLLTAHRFRVTQDQDYLNVLCKDKVTYFDLAWNKTSYEWKKPFKGPKVSEADLKIIHYKINWKPWHYDGVLYEDYFWNFAKMTEFYDTIIDIKNSYSEEEKKTDLLAYDKLVKMAIEDTKSENGYYKVIQREARERELEKLLSPFRKMITA